MVVALGGVCRQMDISQFSKSKMTNQTAHNSNSITLDQNDVQKNLNVVDLTGAGDLFASGYLHGYLNAFSEEECLNKGTEMSSKVIQQIGARL